MNPIKTESKNEVLLLDLFKIIQFIIYTLIIFCRVNFST